MPQHHAVIFDLDGTLTDTLVDLANAGNHMLEVMGHPPRPIPDYRFLAGQGLRSLVVEALEQHTSPVSEAAIQQGIDTFLKYYTSHRFDHTRPYEGIDDLLSGLEADKLKLAILSNKPHDETVAVVAHLLSQHTFHAVVGHRQNTPLKPDPTSAIALVQAMRLTPNQCVYVGDTQVDMKTGNAAGLFTVGVTWGFRDEAELREHGAQAIIHRPAQLLDLLR